MLQLEQLNEHGRFSVSQTSDIHAKSTNFTPNSQQCIQFSLPLMYLYPQL